MSSNVSLEVCVDAANTGLDAIKRAPIVEHDTGIKCLRIQDVSQSKDFENWGFTEVTPENFKKFQLKKDDILIARTGGSIGVNRYIAEDMQAVYNNGLIRIRVDTEKYFPKFVYYLLRTDSFKQHINSIAFSTAAQPNMKIRDFLRFEFLDLPLEIQIQIADNLSNIDDKIELNRQTNQTLEHMAQAIFKSWFVDFEPTRAKALARAQIAKGIMPPDNVFASTLNLGEDAQAANAQQPLPKNFTQADADQIVERTAMAAISGKPLSELDKLPAETLEQLKTTAALFPETLVDSELGEIPEGWGLGELKNIAEFSTDRVNASVLTLENYISTENMLEGKKGISRASSLPTVKTVPSFKPGQILISNIRPYFMKIWLARFEGGRSNDVLGINAKEPEGVEYLYNLLYQDVFFNFMMTTSKGAKMPRGDKEAIMGWVCVQPCVDIKKEYSEAVGDFYKVVDSNNKENMSLEETRNALLPKLLSGEIEVDNAA